ncbi:U-box domain-containing protein 19-like [Cajanus cajan]|uniref:U-box domain-containing protein 19-like n=1 Tax=Cajanus cajan TaxID=3821 RepID=UPI0010FB6CB3|nr:U-box domain-containing protein 19-like [Cajanus cajan]
MFPHQHRQLPPQPHFLLYHPQNAASWRRFRGPDLRFQFQLRFVPLLSHPLRLEKMYIVLHKIKTLIEDCSNGRSKFNLLVQIETVADTFHGLTGELSTLLDVFPLQELHLNDDVQELVILLRKQCSESIPFVGAEQISCVGVDNMCIIGDVVKRQPLLCILDGEKRKQFISAKGMDPFNQEISHYK